MYNSRAPRSPRPPEPQQRRESLVKPTWVNVNPGQVSPNTLNATFAAGMSDMAILGCQKKAKKMAGDMVVCKECKRDIRDRSGKISKSVTCVDCGSSFHASCVRIDQKRLEELVKSGQSWSCLNCKRSSFGQKASAKNSVAARSKSVSDENAAASSAFMHKLSSMAVDLGGLKKAALEMGSSLPGAPEICGKIDYLISEVKVIKNLISEQEKKIANMQKAQIELESDNVRLRDEIRGIKVSSEVERQRSLRGNILLCGLPTDVDLDPKSVFKKLCVRLNVQPEKTASVGDQQFRRIPVENKSAKENNLLILNLNMDLRDEIVRKYKELKKEKKLLKASDLLDSGDGKPIYINEHLSGYFQFLFKLARDMRRNGVIRYVWISEGKLLVRKEEGGKIHQIKHQCDLEKLQ
ncbi:uncharacterized protein LOC129793945 isoform X1 [Lutzomyia longipalpis]|uniref:uncharacterized protein LOC129793945 isoform X1 n=1 Tax=Lutzomyia longipalpis TaxID=7200 RepID=UPI002483A610|nr:uncharacterized protein LOC129793945 isoform X1 [Lutzomyia longipalpis]XP_055690457.1 uncharacterized protein LOC129793945 isoform X1 [Lutzomyia longipalpis]XP_055690458.1 uncharacterized protein LOC129793945 isoform X1 [Lutzomyia longipalpis]